MKSDFSGYATKNGVLCSDGRTILADAFKQNDGKTVPLVWQHLRDTPEVVLGHAVLENRNDGVYTYCFFNNTAMAQHTKEAVSHGDVTSLSIYANKLKHRGDSVVEGDIKEVSLVLAGANPGALIDNVSIQHGDGFEVMEEEAVIYMDQPIEHEDKSGDTMGANTGTKEDNRTVQDVVDSMTQEQKEVVALLLENATENSDNLNHSDDENESEDDNENSEDDENKSDDKQEDKSLQHNQEGTKMGRNVFEQNGDTIDNQRPTLTHSQIETIVNDAEKLGSFKESVLAHADEYGITNIDLLFPDAKTITSSPDFIKRRTEWVDEVISGTRHSPFSRIKTLFADITLDTARAKGYVKGSLKKEEFFSLTHRVTTPTTVYKKQKLDRDDIIDITELDVVAWIKAEMRLMLDEELARAILFGDGREVDNEDKIKDPSSINDGAGIRSIVNDDEFYAHPVNLPTNVSPVDAAESIIRAFEYYRGSGAPTMYVSRGFYSDLILAKDKMGRRLYETSASLAAALGVSKIVTIDLMSEYTDVLAVVVNLQDYTIGADKGGAISMFDDFDIDYNQFKYLLETRVSGALAKWKSALVIKRNAGTSVTPTAPTFDNATGVITIPTTAGVTYTDVDGNTLPAGNLNAIPVGMTIQILAVPNTNYYFPGNTQSLWTFERLQEVG